MLVSICNYDYYNNDKGPVLFLICRNEKLERIIIEVQDERLSPRMYIKEEDLDLFIEEIKSHGLYKLITSMSPYKLKSSYNENTIKITAKYPGDVRKLRECVRGIITFQSDVKWEKMVFQEMQWKQFLKIRNYDEYNITLLDDISNTDEVFNDEFNICYWDIETDGRETKHWASWKHAKKIKIITYVTYNKFKNEYIYYAWQPEWENEIIEEDWATHIPEKTLSYEKFNNYPEESKLITKKFNNEVDMHKQFIKDFSHSEFDGVMTFNGRGGNKVVGAKRKWFDGFDLPIFYHRCIYLGLHREIQKLSPVPIVEKWGRINEESVKAYKKKNRDTKSYSNVEIFMKCIPHHDFYYDAGVLMYTKNERGMKRKRLEDYMNYFLSSGKIKHVGSVAKMFYDDWKEERHYNIVDVEGMFALDTNFGYIDDVTHRSLLFGGKIEDGVYASKVHDHINLWHVAREYLMDTRPDYDENTGKPIQLRKNIWHGLIKGKIGGYNLPVDFAGVYGRGVLLDFSKLYPSCIKTSNADLRTKINVKYIEHGIIVDTNGKTFNMKDVIWNPAGYFRKDIQSLNTIIYNKLIDTRTEYQILSEDFLEKGNIPMHKLYGKIEFSLKGLINGKYGSDGMVGTRSFDYVVYNAAPAMGQDIIKFVIKKIEDYGYTPIFASTDSVMICTKSDTDEKAWDESQEIIKRLNIEIEEYAIKKYNIDTCYLKIGVEKVFSSAVLFDKRRYAMRAVIVAGKKGPIYLKKPRIYYKGLELVRHDSASITGDVQETLIEMILEGKDKKLMFNYLIDLDEKFNKLPWSYICGRSGISNSIDSVSNIESKEKYYACYNANRLFKKDYGAGSNPLLGIFNVRPGHIKDEYIQPGVLKMAFDENDEYPLKKLGFDLDYNALKKTHFIRKVEPILNLIQKGMTYSDAILQEDDLFDL